MNLALRRLAQKSGWNWREGSESATERGQVAVLVRDLGALLGAGVRAQHSLQVRAEWRAGTQDRSGCGGLAGREGPSGGGFSVTVASALSG